MTAPIPWIAHFAATNGFKYEPSPDERWLRVWEPFATLRVPLRYEHALSATGDIGSITIALMIHEVPAPALPSGVRPVAAWVAIAQDVRIKAKFAIVSDRQLVFGEPLDLVSMPRQSGGDAWFDGVFATFGESREAVAEFPAEQGGLTLQVLDAVHIVLRGALRAARDVRAIALIGISIVWVCMPGAAWLFGAKLGLGAVGGWFGFVGETTLGAAALWIRGADDQIVSDTSFFDLAFARDRQDACPTVAGD